MSTTFIIIIILALIIVWGIILYNRFVTYVTRTKEAWSDIDVQLKRRYDLIPNLVNTVKGYAAHEAKTLEAVINARNNAMSVTDPNAKAEAENMLTGALKSIFALAESYPDLKANTNFLELQRELSDTENKIQAARRFYNTNVRDLNILVDTFPSNLLAKMFNFSHMNFFELDASESAAKNPVHVSF